MDGIRPKPEPWTFRGDLELFGIHLPENFDPGAWAQKFMEEPGRNTTALVLVSSVLFLRAEKGHNPKVNDIFDAMVYCSTCLSVGYADIFPRTRMGKLIGTVLMTMGPSSAARVMDGAKDHGQETQKEILSTLQQMLARMENQGTHDDRRD